VKIGANKFFVERTQQNLGTGVSLCTMRGYFYLIRPKMGKILLNVNAATSAFYQPVLLREYLNDTTTFNYHDKMRFIKGVRVYIDYERGGRDEMSRISGCNRPQARVKKVYEVGSQGVNQQQFKETYKRSDGTMGTRYTRVDNYLRNSK
jgi:eukaryotic translation initiation factor 2C